jgi:hypothetical protein
MFTKGFDAHVCEGDSITCEVDGFEIRATITRDDDSTRPDARDCGFWPSKNPLSNGYVGENPPVPFETQMKKAQAVMDTWLADKWFYCGVCVVVSRKGIDLTDRYSNSCWGVECNYPDSDNSHLMEVANDLLGEALAEAKAKLAELCSFYKSIDTKMKDAITSKNS